MARSKGGEGDGAQGVLDIDIPQEALEMQVIYIAHSMIEPDPDQPRKDADDELRASIAQGGVRQPISVREKPGSLGLWLIVDGERRWRGAAGVQAQMPCIVKRNAEDVAVRLRDQVVANNHKNLTPLEQSRVFQRIHQERGGSIADLAKFLGEPVSTVSQRLNLLELGPWLSFIERDVLSYTDAVESLFPYRSCPDSVHAAVVEKLAPELEGNFPGDRMTSDEFEHSVSAAYKPFLYPISKRKDDALPRFNTKDHGAECACNGVILEDYAGKRTYCGNPEWWKPLDAAAKKEQKKAAPTEGKRVAGEDRPRPFYAPADAVPLKGESWETPKGYVELVDSAGSYATARNHELSKAFDPKDVVIEDKQLGVRGNTLYVKESVVKEAREAWATRWNDRYNELLAAFKKTLEKKNDLIIRRDSACRVLAALVISHDGELIDDVINALGMGTDAYADATKDARRYSNGAVDAKAIAAWTKKQDDATAATAVAFIVTAMLQGTALPSEQLRAEQHQAVNEIRKRKNAWAKPPKGEKPEKVEKGSKPAKAAAKKADDEGEEFDDEFEEMIDDGEDE